MAAAANANLTDPFILVRASNAQGSGMLSILAMSVAYIGYFRGEVGTLAKIGLTAAGLLLVGNNVTAIAIGAAVAAAILVWNWMRNASRVAAHT